MIERRNLDGLMGMLEMEDAVFVILGKASLRCQGAAEVAVTPQDFIDADNEMGGIRSLDGFAHLLRNGWLAPGKCNGEWKMCASLLSRLDRLLRKG